MKYEGVEASGVGPKQTTGGTTGGAAEVMEGMAVGGKSCCPITVRGERHGSLAGRGGVTNLSRHNYYCRQFIYFLHIIRLILVPRLHRVSRASLSI